MVFKMFYEILWNIKAYQVLKWVSSIPDQPVDMTPLTYRMMISNKENFYFGASILDPP